MDYPIKDYDNLKQKVVDGFDIYRTGKRWIAIVVIERTNPNGSKYYLLKLYRWINKKGEWKVDLANMNIGYWDINKIVDKITEFKQKYNIT